VSKAVQQNIKSETI